MPPLIATVVYLALVGYLLRRNARLQPNVTPALWLPTIWVFISGTRFVSQWLDMAEIHLGGTSYEEGSPLDAVFFGVMTLLAFRVILRRGVTVNTFARWNQWVFFYLMFCLLACLWSDFPFVAFKRWIKLIGQVAMVLVVLTEPEPRAAVVEMFKRIGLVVLPVSVLFMKYFPQWGRAFDSWTGESMNTGIAADKNALGYDCMLVLIALSCHLAGRWPWFGKARKERWQIWFDVVFAAAILWLLFTAHSTTALVCALVGSFIIAILGLQMVNPRRFGIYLLIIAAVALVGEYGFGLYEFIITTVLHKDPTLTDRTLIWEALLSGHTNWLIGTGYESFWLGQRREVLWQLFPNLHLNSAHNGYLQAYLDTGVLGLLITLGLVVAAYRRTMRAISEDFLFARYQFGIIVAFVLYNWTEVGFRMHGDPFFAFLLAAIEYPQFRTPAATGEVWNPEQDADA
jgi:O-antigen ligase